MVTKVPWALIHESISESGRAAGSCWRAYSSLHISGVSYLKRLQRSQLAAPDERRPSQKYRMLTLRLPRVNRDKTQIVSFIQSTKMPNRAASPHTAGLWGREPAAGGKRSTFPAPSCLQQAAAGFPFRRLLLNHHSGGQSENSTSVDPKVP